MDIKSMLKEGYSIGEITERMQEEIQAVAKEYEDECRSTSISNARAELIEAVILYTEALGFMSSTDEHKEVYDALEKELLRIEDTIVECANLLEGFNFKDFKLNIDM